MKPTSVIIMDTHPIIRMSIEVLLQKNSELQIVLKTDDYRITIDYLRTRPVDLIIMDIDLPGTDGFTFLKRIKQIQSTVKVLFLSSKSECFYAGRAGNDSNLLIVFYVQIMPDDFVMQLHRF